MPFCPQCGTGNPDGARFCQSCGKPMPAGGGAPPSAPAPPPPPPSYPPPGQAPYPPQQPNYGPAGYPPQAGAPPVRRKSPGAACALGLLWGFGAQAFYNGQPLKAVVQIVLNLLIMWPMLQYIGGGGAMFIGCGVAAIFMADGYKVAQKINAGVPVGPWTFF